MRINFSYLAPNNEEIWHFSLLAIKWNKYQDAIDEDIAYILFQYIELEASSLLASFKVPGRCYVGCWGRKSINYFTQI